MNSFSLGFIFCNTEKLINPNSIDNPLIPVFGEIKYDL